MTPPDCNACEQCHGCPARCDCDSTIVVCEDCRHCRTELYHRRFTCPQEICDSEVIQVVGAMAAADSSKVRTIGEGEITYQCAEVRDGKVFGKNFAVGSDELAKWQIVGGSEDTDCLSDATEGG